MQRIFEEYGGVIIALVAIGLLVTIIMLLLAANDSGVVYNAYKGLLDQLTQIGSSHVTVSGN